MAVSFLKNASAGDLAADPTPSYRAAWAQAITNQQLGITAVSGMPSVAALFPPETPNAFLLMAQITGYVYADNYWTGVNMAWQPLSAAMQIGMQWGQPDCDAAAQTAFQTWAGIFLRKSLYDVGTIPYPAGDFTASPDTLTNGTYQLPVGALVQQWSTVWWNVAAGGMANYVYTRGANLNFNAPIPETEVTMFITQAGFNIPPSSWQQLYTSDLQPTLPLSDPTGKPSLDIGARGALAKAFIWYPPSNYTHYCGISVAKTPFFTNHPLAVVGNWDSQTWLVHNGAAAWHNFSNAISNSVALRFHNQDDRPERFAFEAHGRVPVGTKISLSSYDPDHAATVSGAAKISHHERYAVAEGTFPANYAGDIVLDFDVPGHELLPAGASIDVRMIWIVEPGHPHYADAVEQFGQSNGAIRVPLGNYTLVGA